MDKSFQREALILAGGLGTRLRPAINDRPKPLADVVGRPFLERLLDQLGRFDYQRAILCVGYRGEQVRTQLGDRYGALALDYSFEEHPLGTGGALRKAAPMLQAPHVLAMNGDSYCDIDLAAFAAAHLRFGGEATMAVLHRDDRHRSGTVELDAQSRIVAFASRPAVPQPGLINAGVYMFRRAGLDAIPQDRAVSLEDEVFPQIVARQTLFGWRIGANFIDIGTPESYRDAQKFFAER
jgi:D-glycero-alpha-D-manno-heptose 1-phosphate guanylyltransferase